MAAPPWSLAAIAVGCLVVSGCTEASSSSPLLEPGEEIQQAGPLVSETTGAIVGVVIDDGLAPVLNATISVFNTSKESEALATATTDAAGGFAVGQLMPQTYRVTAEADGFAVSSQLVQVVAGEVVRQTFTMGSVASKQPYIELLIESGVAGCSVTAVWLVLGGPCPLVFTDTYKTQFKHSVADDWAYSVFEGVWQTRDAIWMFVDLDDDGTCLNPGAPCPGSIMGTSPVRVDGAPESGLGTDQYQHGDITYPPAGQAFDVWINFSDFGILYDELNNYGKPVCDLNGYCGGVGTALEIRFDSYTSIFHHEPPPAPDQYTALPDS